MTVQRGLQAFARCCPIYAQWYKGVAGINAFTCAVMLQETHAQLTGAVCSTLAVLLQQKLQG